MVVRKNIDTFHLESTHGLDFKTSKFPAKLYIAVTVLMRRILYAKKSFCAILDELCYVC